MIDFSNIHLPFSVTDFLRSSVGLLTVIGGIILLNICFIFVPDIIKSIRYASGVMNSKEYKENNDYLRSMGLTQKEISKSDRRWAVHVTKEEFIRQRKGEGVYDYVQKRKRVGKEVDDAFKR